MCISIDKKHLMIFEKKMNLKAMAAMTNKWKCHYFQIISRSIVH